VIIVAMRELSSTPLVLGPIRVVVLSTESMFGFFRCTDFIFGRPLGKSNGNRCDFAQINRFDSPSTGNSREMEGYSSAGLAGFGGFAEVSVLGIC
jgi:hypothetical protein